MSKWVLSCLFSVFCALAMAAARATEGDPCSRGFRVIRSEQSVDPDDQVLQQVLNKAGCRVEIVPHPGRVSVARRFELLRQGDIDLMSGVSRLPERESWARFSLPVRRENFRAWIRPEASDRAKGKAVAELIRQGWTTIGPEQGYFGAFYQGIRTDPMIQSVGYHEFGLGVRSLLRGRGDLLLGDESWQRLIPASQRSELLQLDEILHTELLHISYSRKTVDEKTVQRLDRIILELELPKQELPKPEQVR